MIFSKLTSTPLSVLLIIVLSTSQIVAAADSKNSQKRGLVHIPSEDHPTDTAFLTRTPEGLGVATSSPLKWYYNYQSRIPDTVPTLRENSDKNAPALEFVPMLWGGAEDEVNGFEGRVRKLIDDGVVVKNILGFNEPDMENGVGGSNIDPETAARLWKDKVMPLKGTVRLGAPAVAGWEGGKEWLKEFFKACDDCHFDFLPVHWYGDFASFASWLGEMHATYPDLPLWVTEVGFPHQEETSTFEMFQSSIDYMDRVEYVERYSWFGSFRADVSNVGPHNAMMDDRGRLTDLGRMYLRRTDTERAADEQGTAGRRGTLNWWVTGMVAGVVAMAMM